MTKLDLVNDDDEGDKKDENGIDGQDASYKIQEPPSFYESDLKRF